MRLRDYRFHRARQLIRVEEEEEKMKFQKQSGNYKPSSSRFLPILPLIKIELTADELKDKTKFVTFECKVKAGAPANGPTYKKNMRTFEEGNPQEWMDVLTGLREIWRQNSVTGPTDQAATVTAILKGDALSTFETALEDARHDPDKED